MAQKPTQYGQRPNDRGGYILSPFREDNIVRLFDPKREDNIVRRLDPRRDDNIVRSLFGMDNTSRQNRQNANRAPARQQPPGRSALSVLSDKTIPLKERWSVSTPRDPGGPPKDNTQYNKTLEDFLALAQQIVGGQAQSQLSGIGNQEAALKQNAEEIRGKIGGGYNALSSFISGQAPVIQGNFDRGIGGIGNAATQAQTSISEGAAAAQAQQQAILDRLGIADANIPIANTGTTLEAQMAQQIADSAQRAQNAQTQLSSNAATEQTFNTSMGKSAALEGQGQQDRINRDLLSRLAELADQRRMIQSSAQTDASRLAADLMDRDYQIWSGNYDRRFNADQSAMDFAQQQAQMQAEQQAAMNKPQELNSTRWDSFGPAGQAAYALEQSGVAPDQAKAIVAEIDSLYADGGGNLSPAQFVARIQKIAEERGLDPINTSNAAAIYYAYYGN